MMKFRRATGSWFKDHFFGLKNLRYDKNSWKVEFRPAMRGLGLSHTIYEHFIYDKRHDKTYIVMYDCGFIDFFHGYVGDTEEVLVYLIEGKASGEEDLCDQDCEVLQASREELYFSYEKKIDDRKDKES